MNHKSFIREYFEAISGKRKTKVLIDNYVSDPKLKAEVQFYESVFPQYEIIPLRMYAEGNRVFAKTKIKAVHLGPLNGIPPTKKSIELLMAAEYTIENNKIVDHWLVFDRMSMMEQLGLVGRRVRREYA